MYIDATSGAALQKRYTLTCLKYRSDIRHYIMGNLFNNCIRLFRIVWNLSHSAQKYWSYQRQIADVHNEPSQSCEGIFIRERSNYKKRRYSNLFSLRGDKKCNIPEWRSHERNIHFFRFSRLNKSHIHEEKMNFLFIILYTISKKFSVLVVSGCEKATRILLKTPSLSYNKWFAVYLSDY